MLHDSVYAKMIAKTSQCANIQISRMTDPKKSDDLLSLKDTNHYTLGFDEIKALNTYLKTGAAAFSQVNVMHI
jgi:hypothetical protein